MSNDQHIRYINKRRTVQTPPPILVQPNVMENLSPTDLKTNVQGKSAIVTSVGKSIHIVLNNVKSWYSDGNILYISSIDNSTPILLQFATTPHAIQAEVRFCQIFNGGLLI